MEKCDSCFHIFPCFHHGETFSLKSTCKLTITNCCCSLKASICYNRTRATSVMSSMMANSKRNSRSGGVIAQIEANTSDAIKCLQDENSVVLSGPPFPQTTEAKKKVAVKRALNRLGRVINDLSTIETYTADLQEERLNVRKKLQVSETAYKELEESTSNMRDELETCQAKLKETTTRLQDGEDRIKLLSKELETAKLSAEVGSKDRPKTSTQERVRSKDGDKGPKVQMDEYLLLVTREENLRAENEKLKKEHMAAVKEKKTRDNNLRNASHANVERYKEVIAKVTADNMVFLMKLKQSEAALTATQSRVQDLQREVEMTRGQWLEEASAEVQGIILDSLRKAEDCESKLRELEAQRDVHVDEWEAKLKTANEKLDKVMASRDWHEKKLVEFSEKYKILEEEKLKLQQKSENDSRHRQHAESESRSLINSLRETKEKLASVNSELAAALKEIEDKKQQLFEKDLEIKELVVQLGRANNQLETQLKVNGVLMKKKEAVEWELMEAQAQRDKLQECVHDQRVQY
ncbi:hypothetical protein R1flu_019153 [Riccia fluitans]|uniref:Uncharacterized protein n=1 Tax=Riccia fluitans TaxID=41844 RepID=A0ABD1ZI75_9MARC